MFKLKLVLSLLLIVFGFQNVIIGQCATTLDAGSDQTLCENNGYMTVQLQASSDGTVGDVVWAPSDGLSDPNILNPLATVDVTTVYTITATSLNNQNLIVDGDFEEYKVDIQPTTFTSDYTFDRTMIFMPGHYAMVQNPPVTAPNFNICPINDHTFDTPNTGNLMIANGTDTPADQPYIWCQDVTITPNTDYVFQFWSVNLDPQTETNGIQPVFQVVMRERQPPPAPPIPVDSIVLPITDGPAVPCVWELTENFWNSRTFSGVVNMCIGMPRSFNGSNPKNYAVAIDDIQMYEVCGTILSDDVTITTEPAPFNAIDTVKCVGQPIRIGNVVYTQPGFHDIVLHENDPECDTIVSLSIMEFSAEALIFNGGTEINCFDLTLPLEGSFDSNIFIDENDITYQWSTIGGNIIGDPNAQFIEVDQAGQYFLSIQSDDPSIPCEFGDAIPITITENLSAPLVDAGPDRVIGCGVSTIQLGGSGSGIPPAFRASWKTEGGNITQDPLTFTPTIDAAGLYILEVSDENNGCASMDTMEVIIDRTTPNIMAPNNLSFDCMQSAVEIDASNSTLNDRITISWMVAGGGAIVSNPDSLIVEINGAGTYTLTLQDTTNGCSDSHDVVVTGNNDGPSIDPPIDRQLDCDSTTVTILGGYNGTLTGFTIDWSTVNGNILSPTNQRNVQVDQPGDYQIIVTNTTTSCRSSSVIMVTQNTSTPQADAGTSQTIDCTSSSVNLNGSGSSGPNLSVDWSTTNGNIVSGGNSFTPTVNSSGRYYIEVSNSMNGCTAIDSVEVNTSSGLPSVNIQSADTLNCLQAQIQLDGSASSSGGTFSPAWTTTTGNILSGANSLLPTVNGSGTYTLTVTNSTNNCTNSAQVFVEQFNNQPSASIANATSLTCRDTQVSLDATASTTGSSITYSWSTTGGNIVSGNATNQPTIDRAGSYIITVTDNSSHCTATSSVMVISDTSIPTAEAGPGGTLDCQVNQLSLDGSGSSSGNAFAYAWTTSGGNILSGQNGLTPLINAQGTYYITVENIANGCTGIDSTVVNQSGDLPIANAGAQRQLTCTSNMATLDGSGSDSGGNISYTWSTTNGNIVSGTNDVMCTVDQIGTYTLEVRNTGNGCTATSGVEVVGDFNPPSVAANTMEELSCTETIVQLDATGSETGPNISYQWNTQNGNIVSGGTTTQPRVDQIGTYTIVVTNTSNGCKDSTDVIVGQDASLPTVVIDLPGELTCTDFSVDLNGSNSSSGDFSYLWTTSDGSITGNLNSNITEVDRAGTYRLTVTNNQTGCDNFEEVTIMENRVQPIVSAGGNTNLFCGQASTQINGSIIQSTGSVLSEWTTTNGQIVGSPFGLSVEIATPGLYVLNVTDQGNGCESSARIEVTLIDELFVTLDVIQPDCSQPVALVDIADGMGTGPYQYSLNEGNSFKDFPIDNFEPDTIFPMIIRDATGCQKRDTVRTGTINSVQVEIERPPLLQKGESVQLHAISSRPFGDLDSIHWSPPTYLNATNILNPTSTPEDNITYTVYVETYDHCIDTASVRVFVQIPLDYYIPNVFSPNRDNINDYWTIYGNQRVELILSLQLYDRWGTLIYQAENLLPGDERAGWDGRFEGKLVPSAVYIYRTTILLAGGEIIPVSGDVTVMR